MPLDQSDPTEIAGYALRARLGSGGMGSVYLSFTRGGRPLAIKVVRREFADDPEFRRRFRQEVTVAQRVQGLYTAPVLDADPEAPVPWLATAYIAGPPLSQAVAEYGPFPLLTVFRLLGGVAEGLSAIHAAGLVHRDLKPANVLLAQDGPRVIDFGIAHAVDGSALTSSGAIIGTPAFMAPEQVTGRKVSAATDVFALAHLVSYAATGRTVFGEGHYAALVYRIANEPPNLDGCPDSLRPIAERCLAKDPAGRPDLAEVMEYARQMLAGQTIGLVGASWLPDPVASNLAAYETNVAQLPAAPRPAAVAAGTMPPAPAPLMTGQPAAFAQGPGYTQPPGYPPGGSTIPPGPPAIPRVGPAGPRRRGPLRPAVLVPLAAALLVAIGAGVYAAGHLGGGSTPGSASGSSPASATALPPASSGPASAPGAASVAPGASSAPVPSASASSATSGTAYSTPEPFPLCDPNGAQWNLVNLTPETSSGCTQDIKVTANSSGYSYATTSKFPNGAPLTASNTVTVSGSLPGGAGYHNRCLGAAEGGASTGYIGFLCNSGQWYIKTFTGIGSNGVIVGKQLATGSLPFTGGTSYDVSLSFSSGSAKLSITLTSGSASPLVQTFSTGSFSPATVGYALFSSDPTLPINPSDFYSTVSGFIYTAG
jgi:hypothetical protein